MSGELDIEIPDWQLEEMERRSKMMDALQKIDQMADPDDDESVSDLIEAAA